MDGLESEFSEASQFVGTYRTRDNVSNFRLRIRLRKVISTAGTSLTPSSSGGGGASLNRGSTESISRSDDGNDAEDDERAPSLDDVVIGWQQKLFRAKELRYYSGKREEDFSSDVLKKKFYHDVQSMVRKGETTTKHVVYTALDGELFKHSGEDEGGDVQTFPFVPMTTNPEEVPSHLSQLMMEGLRHRRHAAAASGGGGGVGVGTGGTGAGTASGGGMGAGALTTTAIPTSNIVTEEPMNRETQMRMLTVTGFSQLMAIRLDLSGGTDSGGGEADDHVDLCVIRYGDDGVMQLSPDFSSGKKPYRIEVDRPGEDRAVYEYWLDHVSTSMGCDAQLKEALMLNDLHARNVQNLAKEVGDEFEEIDTEKHDRTFRLLINCEIVSAEDFDYDNLSVRYLVELPFGWRTWPLSEQCQMEGKTVTSRTTTDRGTGNSVAHFCHTFTVDLLFDINQLDVEKESMPKWPQIFFEVTAVDSWTRVRTEGYGFFAVPYCVGSYDVSIDTWRPVLPTPRGEMRRYFIGGTPQLDDLMYAGRPSSLAADDCGRGGATKGPQVLSRYGFRTQSSGSIRLRANVVHMSKAFLTNGDGGRTQASRKNRQYLLDRLTAATLFSSVSTVMAAFEKARERFSRAAEGYGEMQMQREPDENEEKGDRDPEDSTEQ